MKNINDLFKKSFPILLSFFFIISCEEDDPKQEDCAGIIGGDNICGCTDIEAVNFDSTATFDLSLIHI